MIQLCTTLIMVGLVMQPVGAPSEPSPLHGLPLTGEEAEAFLETAEVVEMVPLGTGITRPKKVTLTDGTRTLQAVWKTINTDVSRQEMEDGRMIIGFRDSYKHEVAAYELDKMLGLNLVPPTVARVIDKERGSLQLWVEGCITEWERLEQKRSPPDKEGWARQMYKVRLLHQLTLDNDFNNMRNVLVDPDYRVYVVDASRTFFLGTELPNEDSLQRFSRSVLGNLRQLDKKNLKGALGRWLTQSQIKALLARRDAIVAVSERMIEERGEEAVLYP